jgi:hypothetical protein
MGNSLCRRPNIRARSPTHTITSHGPWLKQQNRDRSGRHRYNGRATTEPEAVRRGEKRLLGKGQRDDGGVRGHPTESRETDENTQGVSRQSLPSSTFILATCFAHVSPPTAERPSKANPRHASARSYNALRRSIATGSTCSVIFERRPAFAYASYTRGRVPPWPDAAT